MLEPTFTVIIPCYNGERFLAATLESALGQTLPPLEIIVVDDGSQDRSVAIAESFGPKVVCLRQSHGGPGAARNLGTARARGNFIAFLDADDVWRGDKLERQAEILRNFPQVGLVYTGLHKLFPDGSTELVPALAPDKTVALLPYWCPIIPSTVVASTELLAEEPWRTDLRSSEDWELLYRLSKRCTFAGLAESTTLYRQHPASLSSRNWEAVMKNALKASAIIQQDFHGLAGLRRRRQVNARLYANAALAAREVGSPNTLPFLLRSFAAWPLPSRRDRWRMAARALIDGIRR